MNITAELVYAQTEQAVTALLQENRPHFNPVKLLVIGGSSSEIAGGTIGHNSTYEYGEAVVEAVMKVCGDAGVAPAFQCCEHLNRSLIMERETADLDIGQTLIGMHLRRVAVPVRLSISQVGEARISAARTRPLLVGGERARYIPESEETP